MGSTNNDIATIESGALSERMTPRVFIQDFLAYTFARTRNEKTRNAYTRNINYYLNWLEATGHTGGDMRDITDYLTYLSGRYAPSTVNSYYSIVRSFYKWLEASRIYPNITAGTRGAKLPEGFAKDVLTVDQYQKVLESIDRETITGLRDYAIIDLMIHTALRINEVRLANISDIRQDPTGYYTMMIQGKGHNSKDAEVKFSPEVMESIRAYLRVRGIGDNANHPLFVRASNHNTKQPGDDGRLALPSLSTIIKGRFKAAGVDSSRITAHSLRHTAVTWSILGGATIQEAGAMARHKNIATTMIYAHNVDRMVNPAERKIDAFLSDPSHYLKE